MDKCNFSSNIIVLFCKREINIFGIQRIIPDFCPGTDCSYTNFKSTNWALSIAPCVQAGVCPMLVHDNLHCVLYIQFQNIKRPFKNSPRLLVLI